MSRNNINRRAKDTVFTDLFSDKKYILQMYCALHPEDSTVTEDDISNVTMQNVFIDDMYNDLGFMIKDKLVVLVEAQSTWTVNIIVRCLEYITQTYNEHIVRTEQDIFGAKKIRLPKPELYVLYTGDRKNVPEAITLSDEFFGGADIDVNVTVHILHSGRRNDIIEQYIIFTRIFNEQVQVYGYTRKAIEETVRICMDNNVLKEYMNERRTEVFDIMMSLFDEEFIYKTAMKSRLRDAEEQGLKQGMEKGMEKGIEKGMEKGKAQAMLSSIKAIMTSLQYTAEQAMELLNIPQQDRAGYLAQLQDS